jgi:hypothetical protein
VPRQIVFHVLLDLRCILRDIEPPRHGILRCTVAVAENYQARTDNAAPDLAPLPGALLRLYL